MTEKQPLEIWKKPNLFRLYFIEQPDRNGEGIIKIEIFNTSFEITHKFHYGSLMRFFSELLMLIYGNDEIDQTKCIYDTEHPKKRNLLILGCSKTKNLAEGKLRAIDCYTGIFFKVLKKNNPELKNLNVIIISAKYGILRPENLIENYDQKMTKQRAIEHRDNVTGYLKKFFEIYQYENVCVNLGKMYYLATNVSGKIPNLKGNSVQFLHGAPGERMAQLKAWLLKIQRKDGLLQYLPNTIIGK